MKRLSLKRALWIIIGVGLLAIWLLEPFLDYLRIAHTNIELPNKIDLSLTFVTIVLLYWYTHDTEGIKKEAIAQNEFDQRPIINLYYRDEDRGRNGEIIKEGFRVRGVGKSPAYNIQIHPIQHKEIEYRFFIEQENVLLEGGGRDQKSLQLFARDRRNGATPGNPLLLLKKGFSLKEIKSPKQIEDAAQEFICFLITYRSLSNKDYYSIFKYYSKHPFTEEFTLEFIKSDRGSIKYEGAIELCRQSPRQRSAYERAFERDHTTG